MPQPSILERLKRARIVRVLAVYLAAAWLVLEVTATLEDVLALPDWTAAVAFVLLLSGLVVILATAWVQSHPSVEAREATGELPDDWELDLGDLGRSIRAGRVPHLTWGRALAGGAVVFALLFGLAGGYVLFSDDPRMPGGAAPLAAEPAAAPGVAVVPFSVSGPELDLWREGLVDLLATNLDGLGGLRGIDSRTVLARWAEAVPSGTRPDLSTMLAVARDADARWALVGSLVGADQVRLSADVYDLETGAKLGTARAEGGADAMMALVDELTVGTARLLLDRDPAEGGVHNLASVTTGSLPALEAYLQGEALYRRGEYRQAIDRFDEAVTRDSTFALAWMRLHDAYGWTEVGGEAYTRSAERAIRYRDRLPAREQLLVRTSADFAVGALAELPDLETAVRLYPDDPEIVYELGEYYLHYGGLAVPSLDSALTTFERAIALDPTFGPYYVHAVDLGIMVGDSARTVPLLEGQRRAAPTDRHHLGSAAAFDLVFGDSATRDAAWSRIEARPREHYWAVISLMDLSHARLRERVGELTFSVGDPGTLIGYLDALVDQGRIRDASAFVAAEESLDPAWLALALRATGLPVVPAGWQPHAPDSADSPSSIMTAGLAAADGDPDAPTAAAVRAAIDRRRRDALAAGDTVEAGRWTAMATTLDAYAAWTAGDPATALADLEEALEGMPAWVPNIEEWVVPSTTIRWWLGEVNAELDRPEAAARHYERLFGRLLFEPLAQYRLGEIYERLGRPDDARRAYAAFVDAWRDADPGLRSLVDHARDRLADLTAEG